MPFYWEASIRDDTARLLLRHEDRDLAGNAPDVLRGDAYVWRTQMEGVGDLHGCLSWRASLVSILTAMKLAYQMASKSPDLSNQNGAVLLNFDGDFVKAGCNRFPRGFRPEREDFERPRKYNFMLHAEHCAVIGENCTGCRLICPWAACCHCAISIVESGVRELVTHRQRMDMTPDRWEQSVSDGNRILRSGGVILSELDMPLGLDFTIRVNGEGWSV